MLSRSIVLATILLAPALHACSESGGRGPVDTTEEAILAPSTTSSSFSGVAGAEDSGTLTVELEISHQASREDHESEPLADFTDTLIEGEESQAGDGARPGTGRRRITARAGRIVGSGGRSSATSVPRWVTRTDSPASTRRT